jgi:DNA polymerase-1
MPYGCRHFRTGELYDYKTVEGRSRWNEKNGEISAWITEDNEPWTETDVHSATTTKALEIMGFDWKAMSEKEFANWRKKGKMTNFLRNYQGSAKACADQLEVGIEEATALVDGYTAAFPVVITYQQKVNDGMLKGYVQNLRGRRYYISDSRKFYKAGNYLIQGSCADILKEKMIQIDRFLVENNCKTRMIMCIHDEIQFEVPASEDWVVPELKRMMEDTPDVMVPIVADVEFTETHWAAKEEIIF